MTYDIVNETLYAVVHKKYMDTIYLILSKIRSYNITSSCEKIHWNIYMTNITTTRLRAFKDFYGNFFNMRT
jgi:hypothetical protein